MAKYIFICFPLFTGYVFILFIYSEKIDDVVVFSGLSLANLLFSCTRLKKNKSFVSQLQPNMSYLHFFKGISLLIC